MVEGITLSTPIRRLGAALLDNVIMGALSVFIFIPVVSSQMFYYTSYSGNMPNNMMNGFVFSKTIFLIFAYSIGMLVIQIYFWSKSQSIGKAILGMKVVDTYSQEPLGLGKMVIRELIGKWISGLVMSLGYIWILIDKDHQGWHDKLISSYVVDIEK